MNRKNQNQDSTERILKSKYLEKQKSGFNLGSSNPSKKVMLTDLCPQQKLKVGQLIKINENRKQQILELSQQMNEIRIKFADSHSRLIEIEQEFQSKQQQCRKLALQIEDLQQKSIELQISNGKLVLQNKSFKQTICKIQAINRENCSTQTEQTSKTDASIQTKKNKTKAKEIQVQQGELLRGINPNGRYHSKSFDRILKENERSLKSSNSRSHKQIAYSQSTLKGNQEYEEDEQNQQYKESHELLVEERLNDLAKQWLELKQKKVSSLKAQYDNSKAILLKGDFIPPKEFTCEDLVDSIQNQAKVEQIDDNQLNNLLKSENFSASRLLTSKGLANQSQNSRKDTLHGRRDQLKKQETQINYSNKQDRLNIGGKIKKTVKLPSHEQYQQIQNNFYESDFMELVNSLNQ